MADAEFTGPFDETLDTIRDRELATMRALYPDPETRPDLRQPGAMWNFLSVPAAELALVYLEMNEILRNAFIQYADAPYLDYLAEQNGITRLAATTSNGVLRFMGDIDAVVPTGTSVSTEPIRTGDASYTFDTTEEGTLVGLEDPAVAPTAHPGMAVVSIVTEGVAATTDEVQRVTLHGVTGGDFTLTYSGQTTAAIPFNATAAQVRSALVSLSNIGGVNEVQTVTVDATSGTFTITYSGQTTSALAYNVSAADMQTALEALSNLAPGDVVVTGGPGNSGGTTPYILTFGGTLAYTNVAQVTCTDISLAGGGDSVTPATTTSGVVPDVSVTGAGPWDVTFINALAQTDVSLMTADSTALVGTSGPISGDVVYQFAYVTNLNAESSDYGYTLASPASSPVENLSSDRVEVSIPPISWSPTEDLTDISEVLVYRSYKSLADTDFSEYKYVGSILTNPKVGGVFIDDVTDSEFLLISEDTEARGGVPSVNSTGVVEVAAVSQEAGLATAAASGTIQNLDDDIPGVEAATNPEDFTGGSDEEVTEALRERTLEVMRSSAGAGNVAAYIAWAKSIDGIYSASVTPEWDGPGTVKIVLAGANSSQITDLNKIEEVRQYIAGTIAILDPTTNPITTSTATTGGAMLAGTYNYVFTYVNEGGGETKPSPAVTQVVPPGTSTNKITVDDIPLGPTTPGPEAVTARRIYRSFSGDTIPRFELVTELEDNTTTLYEDIEAQSTLPAPAEPSGVPLTAHYAPKSNSTSLYNGVAPIGAHVSIETITPLGVTVNATIVPAEGYSLAGTGTTVNLSALIHASLEAYFDSLDPGQLIRFKDVENAIHDTVGVADFAGVEILADPYVTPVTTNLAIDGDQAVDYNSLAAILTEAVSV